VLRTLLLCWIQVIQPYPWLMHKGARYTWIWIMENNSHNSPL
jgi:hypothetical protein